MSAYGLYQAEGFYYSRDHLIERGCVENYRDICVFAHHSTDPWEEVAARLQGVWGHGSFWRGPELVKSTAMRDGQTNYVFRISPITLQEASL